MKDNVDPSLYDKIMKDMPEVIEGDSFITQMAVKSVSPVRSKKKEIDQLE